MRQADNITAQKVRSNKRQLIHSPIHNYSRILLFHQSLKTEYSNRQLFLPRHDWCLLRSWKLSLTVIECINRNQSLKRTTKEERRPRRSQLGPSPSVVSAQQPAGRTRTQTIDQERILKLVSSSLRGGAGNSTCRQTC